MRVTFVDDVRRDLLYAVRVLRRSPSFTAVAVLTLALGIGANTAIFSLVDAVLLKSLPVREPERLVVVDTMTPRGERRNISYRLFEALRGERDVFAGVLAAQDGTDRIDMVGPESSAASEETIVQLVSGEYFEVLGVRAAVGRMLNLADDAHVEPAVAVLSYGFWDRRFSRDPAVIGKSLRLKGQPMTIVGVAPPGFFGEAVGRLPDMWIPLYMQPRFDRVSMLNDPRTGWLRVVGRLRRDVKESQASAALEAFLSRVDREATHLNNSTRFIERIRLSDGSRGLPEFRERFSLPLRILTVVVTLVLLIACANVSNLLLARATMRQREVAVRLAIGASRRRLIRQFLTESLLLAGLGAVLGVFLAWWGSAFLLVFASESAAPLPIDLTPNIRVLGFTTTVSLISVLVFGLLPALTGSSVNAGVSLKPSGGAFTRARVSRLLVVAQVAVSLVLLTGATLLAQTLRNLRARDLGFATETLLQGRIRPEQSGYRSQEIPALSRRLVERLADIPGVEAAAMAHSGYGTGMSTTCCFAVEGFRHDPTEDRQIATLGIGVEYFRTMRMRLVRGREFAASELVDDPRRPASVTIVNETFARRYFHDGDAIGRRIGWGNPPNVTYGMEIVGIVGDAVYGDPRQPAKPIIYLPSTRGTMFLVRAAGSPEPMIATIRREIRAFEPKLEFSVGAVSAERQRALVREKVLSTLASFFGALAAVLAGVGLYALLAYSVTRRTREIGICMALGANRGSIIRGEIHAALGLAAVGISVGVPTALASGLLIKNQLFGVSAADPMTLIAAVAILAAITGAAAYLPAHRASRVDPMAALRWE